MGFLCAPGVVAEALELLMQGELAQAEFDACVRCDPVLGLRLSLLPADFSPKQQDLLRALLLTAPVATGAAQETYAARWRQSVSVAYLAQALAARSGLVNAGTAWMAGLNHNLADYLDSGDLHTAQTANWLNELDPDGWMADAVRYHAEPLALGRAAHPLVRIVQLAYQLFIRPDAVDSVDVRAALSALHLGAVEAADLLAESQAQARKLALRFGLVDAPSTGSGFERLARLYAVQAAQSALHSYFRHANGAEQVFLQLLDSLRALFGVERACLFTLADDGTLRLGTQIPAVSGLSALAIPPDDGHSALARALARNAPQPFESGAANAALVDEQIARMLGVSRFLCQPMAHPDGKKIGVLLVGDAAPDLGASPLWRFTLAECIESLSLGRAQVPSHMVPVRVENLVPDQAVPVARNEDIPRDRVRRAVHEVANPLTIMRNYVNLLSDRLGSDSAMQRDLSIIGDEIERVARIVRGITVAEEEVATPPAALELVSVNSIVSELVRMALGTLFTPNKVNVQIDLNPDVPPLPLQKDLLKQVLFNLAKNAVEAMRNGGHLKFTTRLVDSDGLRQVEIEVADTGPGLSAAVASRLFEPVVSEKGGDHSGLGLNISRNLVERMRGQLKCTSTPQGTHFLIRLPTLQNGQAPLTTTRYGSM